MLKLINKPSLLFDSLKYVNNCASWIGNILSTAFEFYNNLIFNQDIYYQFFIQALALIVNGQINLTLACEVSVC